MSQDSRRERRERVEVLLYSAFEAINSALRELALLDGEPSVEPGRPSAVDAEIEGTGSTSAGGTTQGEPVVWIDTLRALADRWEGLELECRNWARPYDGGCWDFKADGYERCVEELRDFIAGAHPPTASAAPEEPARAEETT